MKNAHVGERKGKDCDKEENKQLQQPTRLIMKKWTHDQEKNNEIKGVVREISNHAVSINSLVANRMETKRKEQQ